jgi:hypothetical protein
MIKIRAFKKKERRGEGRPRLRGQWKVPKLGGQWGNIFLGGQWKVPMLGGPWKVPSLVTFGTRRRNILFTSFHFPPIDFT